MNEFFFTAIQTITAFRSSSKACFRKKSGLLLQLLRFGFCRFVDEYSGSPSGRNPAFNLLNHHSRSHFMKLFHSTAAALLIVTATTTAAFADEVEISAFQSFDIKTATVSFGDLDLASPADAATLVERIEKTSRKVCKRLDSGTGLEEHLASRACFIDSYQGGIATINSRMSLDIESIAARSAGASREVVAAD
jgi:UrcA family protein